MSLFGVNLIPYVVLNSHLLYFDYYLFCIPYMHYILVLTQLVLISHFNFYILTFNTSNSKSQGFFVNYLILSKFTFIFGVVVKLTKICEISSQTLPFCHCKENNDEAISSNDLGRMSSIPYFRL